MGLWKNQKDAMLLALKAEEGATSQGLWAASEAEQRK